MIPSDLTLRFYHPRKTAHPYLVESMALTNETKPVPEFIVESLLRSPTVTIRDTYCRGTCHHQSTEESTTTSQLVFPYRGVYGRQVGLNEAVAEANQALFFNAFEGC